MSGDSSTETPGFAETRIAAAAETWDAVRTNRFLGLQAVEWLGSEAGPVIAEPTAVYFLVPPAPPAPGTYPSPPASATPTTSSSFTPAVL
ncbi:hypothetical protein [Streptomyces microflavus]|uniref:hypothetical protein n=1 Tax=Streptomyces microflavus TaxID=1919 RepID=UPI0033C52C91